MNTSPASAHPELGKSLIKYLRKEVGEVDILLKKPLFHQDFKHILDYLRLETTAALQKQFTGTYKFNNWYFTYSHFFKKLQTWKVLCRYKTAFSFTGFFSKPLYCKVIQLRHSYIVFQLKSIIRSETSFSHIWHLEVHPGVQAKLALTTMDKKTFCVLYERSGFSFTTITNNIIRVSACG